MNSDYLVRAIASHSIWKKLGSTPEKDRIYLAGTFAQKEILNELKLLEQVGNLVLVSGQERYQFPPIAITGGTATTPIQLTITGHLFNTGDTVVITGVSGLTGANGKWSTITKVDANTISLDGSIGGGTYTAATGIAYHILSAAGDVKMIRKTGSATGRIPEISLVQSETERADFGSLNSDASQVGGHYVIYDDPLILGFRGTPGATIPTELIIYRIPLPSEDISATVNPILPAQYDKLLYRATLYHVFDLMDDPSSEEVQALALSKYEQEKQRVREMVGDNRLIKQEDSDTLIL
jgi:hypothetical protein